MKTINLIRVKQGDRVHLVNEDSSVFAEIWQDKDLKQSWANGFKIWFNGKLIDTFKTYKPFENRVNKLIEKWNLTEDTNI